MDLFKKLDLVEIQVTDRFPAEDMAFCRKEEEIYREVFFIYSEVAYIAEDARERLKAFSGNAYVQSLDDNKDKVYDCNERFIHKICGYFSKKYSVSIDYPDWMIEDEDRGRRNKKERYDVVPLQYVLDSIYEQMGGMSFEERAFNELKEDARDAVLTYRGIPKCKIQGVKLVIDDFYCSRKDSIWERYMADVESKHRSFFKALTHFEYEDYYLHQKYGFLCDYRIDEKEGVYDKHVISSTVVSSIKVFKNGKIEIEFKDYKTAVSFMDTYFPGVLQKAA